MRNNLTKAFAGFLLILGATFLYSPSFWGKNIIEDPVVRKNLFSPNRSFSPELEGVNNGRGTKKGQDLRRLRKNIILRGTYCYEQRCWALLELKPLGKRLLDLDFLPPNRTLRVKEGDTIGRCTVKRIEREKVVMGNKCEGLVLTLADSPERKKPVPPPAIFSKQPYKRPQKRSSKTHKTSMAPPSSSKSLPPPLSSTNSKIINGSLPRKTPRIKQKTPSRDQKRVSKPNPFLELLKKIQEERAKGAPAKSRPPFPFVSPPSN